MAFSCFERVRLAALCAVVPQDAVNIEDELRYFGGSLEQARRLSRVSGLSTRRKAPEGVTASDMCIQAARRLLAETGADKSLVDAVLFVSHSPDYLLPASASIQQQALGLSRHCAAMDLNVGCAGFVHGLWLACGLIRSGACRKVLLLVGDTPARFADPDNRVVAPVFGDAGTAALIEGHDNAPEINFLMKNDGAKYEALVVPGGGSRIPQQTNEGPNSPFNARVANAQGMPWTLGDYCSIWMDGMAIYTFGVSVVPKHIREHLDAAKIQPNSLDRLFLHQANKAMLETIGKKVSMPPAKTPTDTLPLYGNLGAASIPTLLCEHYANHPEHEREKTMLCAFGAGLAVSSCLLSLKDTLFLPVHEYEPDPNAPTREQRINYWHKKFQGR